MSRNIAAPAARLCAVLLLTVLTGCAGGTQDRATASAKAKPAKPANQVQKVSYTAPAAETPLPPSLDTALSAGDIELQLAANVGAMADASLGPSQAGRVMTVLYAGDPRDFVDCGKISMWPAKSDKPKSMTASEDKLKLERTSRKPDGRLERTLRLDSRTTVRFSGLPGGSTRVDARTRYILTKEVNSFGFGGGKGGKDKWLGATRETIAFNSGERASFSVGTTCVPTGLLEQAILAGVGAAPASAAAPATPEPAGT